MQLLTRNKLFFSRTDQSGQNEKSVLSTQLGWSLAPTPFVLTPKEPVKVLIGNLREGTQDSSLPLGSSKLLVQGIGSESFLVHPAFHEHLL